MTELSKVQADCPKFGELVLSMWVFHTSYQKKSANRHNESSALHDTCLLEQPTNQISSNWNDPNKKCQLVGCKLHFNTSPPQPPCKQASTACKKSANYTTPKQTNLSRIPPRQPPVLPLISIGEIKPSTRLQTVTLKPWKPNRTNAQQGNPCLPVDAWKQQWAASLYTMPLLHATQLMNICRNGVVVPGVFDAGQVPFGGSQR